MTNFRTVVTIAFLLIASPEAAIAMSPQELPAEVKSCKAITNNKERLKCFDELFAETSKPQKLPEEKEVKEPAEERQGNWSIDETKSTDGIPQMVAANLVGDTVLILRCKDQTIEAAFSTQYNYLGYKRRKHDPISCGNSVLLACNANARECPATCHAIGDGLCSCDGSASP